LKKNTAWPFPSYNLKLFDVPLILKVYRDPVEMTPGNYVGKLRTEYFVFPLQLTGGKLCSKIAYQSQEFRQLAVT
jgi:hypothetical protein